jgi:unspecific monooxygenase
MLKTIPRLSKPQWLQYIHWVLDPISYMRTGKQVHPDIFAADISGFSGDPIIFVQDPAMLQYIFTHDRKELTAPGDGIAVLQPLVGNRSVIMLEGEKHRKRHQLLMPPFHGDRLGVYGRLIARLTQEEIQHYPQNKPFKAHQLTQQLSLQVIMQAVFGLEEGQAYQRTKGLLTYVFDFFNSPVNSTYLYFDFLRKNIGPWKKFIRARNELDTILYEEIASRQANPTPEREDILSLLMAAKDENGEGLTAQELRDELITVILAGLEATSTVMAWALYWILGNEQIRQNVMDELHTLGENPPPETIVRLPYLTAVVQETMRIHPPVVFTFARMASEELELNGWKIPKYSRVAGCIYLLHYREELYPEPTVFRPERFMERKFSAYEFMPFGAGARRCIGAALAQFEIKVAVATLLLHHELERADNHPEKPLRSGVFLSPGRGVPIIWKGPKKTGT